MARSVQGLEKLKRQLASLPDAVKQEVGDEVRSSTIGLGLKIQRACAVPQIADHVSVNKVDKGEAGAAGIRYVIVSEASNGEHGHVYNPRWEEFGTAPHSLARGALAIRKDKYGRVRSNGKKQDQGPWHPGAKARPFFWPTVRAWKKQAKRMLRTRLNNIAKRIAGS
jgi:hypothetical protein